MRLHWTVKAAMAMALLAMAPAAFAQWDLNWYVDPQSGSSNLIWVDPDGIPASMDEYLVPEGSAVYLMSAGADGIVDGIDANGNILGDDFVMILYNGGIARVPVGEQDWPFNPQGPGEFNQTSTLQDPDNMGTLYALAFNTWVAYSGGQFVGFGLWGASGTYNPTGDPFQTWDAGSSAWTLNNQIVPEPATVAMMLAGVGGVLAYRRRRASKA